MAKGKTRMPVTGGTRKGRNTNPSIDSRGDHAVIRYSTIGNSITTDAAGLGQQRRLFIGGYIQNLSTVAGPTITGYYSTAKFISGTKMRWEPSVSFTTAGRVYAAYTDNPEVMAAINALPTVAAYVAAVKSLGTVISFPVWQETDIPFQTRLRKKRFDTNTDVSVTDSNVLDRSAQMAYYFVVDGCPANTTLGSVWFHDVVDVEGLHNTIT